MPITPMPHYSDMDTPELKHKLNRSVCSCLSPRRKDKESEGAYLITPRAVPLAAFSSLPPPPLRFGVRPLPKRQMILKLKEIHQYTHQLVSSDSEDEARSVGRTARLKPSSVSTGNREHSCSQFKQPGIPPTTSPLKPSRENQAELLSASQGSNTSSTAASEDSDR